MTEQRCGNCKHHVHDEGVDFICNCEESDGYGEYTMFQDRCDCWEGKEK